MAHRWLLDGRVMVSAWNEPSGDELRAIVRDATAASARLGQKLLYLSFVGPLAIPSESVRQEIARYYESILACATSMHIVVDGSGLQQSIKRSFIAAVSLVVPTQGRVFFGNSVAAVIAASPEGTRAELTRATETAEAQGLFDLARTSDSVPPSVPRSARVPAE